MHNMRHCNIWWHLLNLLYLEILDFIQFKRSYIAGVKSWGLTFKHVSESHNKQQRRCKTTVRDLLKDINKLSSKRSNEKNKMELCYAPVKRSHESVYVCWGTLRKHIIELSGTNIRIWAAWYLASLNLLQKYFQKYRVYITISNKWH